MKNLPHQTKKQDTELSNKSGSYTPDNILNHPVILKSTFSGTLLTGIMVAGVAWLLSAGIIGNEEPLKITTISPVIFTFIGFIAGSAIGGLIGIVYGIFLMLKEKW